MYVNVNVIYWIQKKQQREIIFIRLEPWGHSPSSILSSLPSPPFLLTCAVRGDINLSDRLCDPPSGLGGRRSAVNINILPGFVVDTEQPWPPWIFIHYHKQKHMSPSARLKSMPSPASATLFPSPLQTKNKTVSLLLVLDCLLIFIATQADRLTCHPVDLQTLKTQKQVNIRGFFTSFPTLTKIKSSSLFCMFCIRMNFAVEVFKLTPSPSQDHSNTL